MPATPIHNCNRVPQIQKGRPVSGGLCLGSGLCCLSEASRCLQDCLPNDPNLPHQELCVQGPGGLDALEDVDHVARGNAQGVQPRDHRRE